MQELVHLFSHRFEWLIAGHGEFWSLTTTRWSTFVSGPHGEHSCPVRHSKAPFSFLDANFPNRTHGYHRVPRVMERESGPSKGSDQNESMLPGDSAPWTGRSVSCGNTLANFRMQNWAPFKHVPAVGVSHRASTTFGARTDLLSTIATARPCHSLTQGGTRVFLNLWHGTIFVRLPQEMHSHVKVQMQDRP